MEEFLKMDIFFTIATAAIVIVGILLALVLWRVYRILKKVEHISQNVSEESDALRKDVGTLRERVREEGMKWSHINKFASSVFKRTMKRLK
jgi:membrane protein implicated in regulation of membrane protease activity